MKNDPADYISYAVRLSGRAEVGPRTSRGCDSMIEARGYLGLNHAKKLPYSRVCAFNQGLSFHTCSYTYGKTRDWHILSRTSNKWHRREEMHFCVQCCIS